MAHGPAEPYWREGDHVPGMPECFTLNESAANLANFIRQATIKEMSPFAEYIDSHRGDPRKWPPYAPGDVMSLDGGLVKLEGDWFMVAINAWLCGWDAGHLCKFLSEEADRD